MAARNLGSTGRHSADARRQARVAKLALAGRQVRGGWVMPVQRTDWFSRVRDRIGWFLASWMLMIATRWYREMISGAVALGVDVASESLEAGVSRMRKRVQEELDGGKEALKLLDEVEVLLKNSKPGERR